MITRNPINYVYVSAIIVLIGLSMLAPIPQDTCYHNFADSRTLYSVSNFWNVLSNIPYFLVGLYAFYNIFVSEALVYESKMKAGYIYFFTGITLVSLGSGYYHLDPNNDTLLWDRLPMSITFMSVFAIIISEFIALEEGKKLLYPLLFLGVFSVIYWAYTEIHGYGDLRLYFFIQFFPILIIPILLVFFQPTFTLVQGYWYLLGSYGLAKICEHYDEALYEMLGFISGHSLKHIISALGLYLLIQVYTKRKKSKIINGYRLK